MKYEHKQSQIVAVFVLNENKSFLRNASGDDVFLLKDKIIFYIIIYIFNIL